MTPTLQIDPNRVVHETIDDEVIIIQLERGNYYSLRGTGREVWTMLGEGASQGDVVARLSGRYRAEQGAIEAAVAALVEQLLEEELLAEGPEGSTGASPPAATNGDAPDQEFEPAKLEKYTDMQDYLLIDPIHDVSGTGWPSVKASD